MSNMDILLALLGVLLPWTSGCLVVAFFWRRYGDRAGACFTGGYGWLVGLLLVILWMRFLALLRVSFSVWTVVFPFVVLLLALTFAWRRLPPGGTVGLAAGWRTLSRWGRVLWWGLLVLLGLRGFQFLLEILWRPSFGWDTWAHWATKAKVWYSLGTIVPFGSAAEVLAGTAQYTDANPHYPPGIPLIQVWMSLCIGHWDDALVNLPWLAFGIALGLGFYAQIRTVAGPLFAMGVTYLLLSLPFVGVHLALPGYADLPLAVFAGLAAISFWRWSMERKLKHLALAILLALGAPMLKTPGWVWLVLLAPAVLPVLFGKRGWKVVLALGAVGMISLFVLAHYDPRIMGYQLHASFQPVWRSLFETTFVLGNWHLLWYTALLASLVFWRALFTARLMVLTIYLGGAFAFLFVVFFFSNAALWVSDFSTVNRALLHLAPTLLFALALLALDLRERMQKTNLSRPASWTGPQE